MAKAWKLQRFYHTVINSSDIQRSVDFYVALGFEVLHDRRNLPWPPQMADLFGLDKAAGGGVLLIVPPEGDEAPTMLDIIQWREPMAKFPTPEEARTTVPRILALKVDDAKAAYEDLSAKGFKFTPAGLFEPGGASMIVRAAHLFDPDGHIVELIELRPGARHSQDFKT